MFVFTAVGVGLVFASSVTISSFGLYAVGLAQGLPPEVAWVTPVMIDVAILVFTMAAMIQKRRANAFARVFASMGVGLATLLSVALNFLHSYYAVGVETLQAATGTVVNTVAPMFIWVTTEMLVMLVTKQPAPPRAAQAKGGSSKRKKPASRKSSSRSGGGDSGGTSSESASSRPASAPQQYPRPPIPTPQRDPGRTPVSAFDAR
jgi:uncharacterized membrane protein YgcG